MIIPIMEKLIKRLLTVDNNDRNQAQKEIKDTMQNPNSCTLIWNVVLTSEDTEVRQYAALLLRKKLTSRRYWRGIQDEVKNALKTSIIERILNEQEKVVKREIVHLAGKVIKMEHGSWQDFFQFIYNSIMGNESSQDMKQLGMYVISILTDVAMNELFDYVNVLMEMFSKTFNQMDNYSSPLAYLTVLSMGHVACRYIGVMDLMIETYRSLMPHTLRTIQEQAKKRPDRCIDCLVIFDGLLRYHTPVICDMLPEILTLLSGLLIDKDMPEEIRNKSAVIISVIIHSYYSNIDDGEVLGKLISTLFQVLCTPLPENVQHYRIFNDDSTFLNTICLIFKSLATKSKPNDMIAKIITSELTNVTVYQTKAFFLLLTATAKSYRTLITTGGYMDVILNSFILGLQSEEAIIRNGAIFALSYFIPIYQENINSYISLFLPILLNFLDDVERNEKKVEEYLWERLLTILDVLCEASHKGNMENFASDLVKKYNDVICSCCSFKIRQVAIQNLGTVADIAGDNTNQLFLTVISLLRPFIVQQNNFEAVLLQSEAFDTIANWFREMESLEAFPVIKQAVFEVLNVTVKMLEDTEDADVRTSIYGIVAAASNVLPFQEVDEFLKVVMPHLLESLKAKEEPEEENERNEIENIGMEEDNSEEESDIDISNMNSSEEEEESELSYNQEIIDEIEEACFAVEELARNLGASFLPYTESILEIIFQLSNHEDEDIRIAAIEALTSIFEANSEGINAVEKTQLKGVMMQLIPRSIELIESDDSISVVNAVWKLMIVAVIVAPNETEELGYYEKLKNAMIKTYTGELECIKAWRTANDEEDDYFETDSESSEIDGDELVLNVGEVLPYMANSLPPEIFIKYFNELLPILLKEIDVNVHEDRRSQALAIISGCVPGLGEHINRYIEVVFPILVNLLSDPNENVRNNSVFAIAEIVCHGKEIVYSYYEKIVESMSTLLAVEQSANVLDNICSLMARLIVHNISLVPVNEVIPAIVKLLPLRQDFNEYCWIYQAFNLLYSRKEQALMQFLPQIIHAALIAINREQTSEMTAITEIISLLESTYKEFPQECAAVVQSLSQELQATYHNICLQNMQS